MVEHELREDRVGIRNEDPAWRHLEPLIQRWRFTVFNHRNPTHDHTFGCDDLRLNEGRPGVRKDREVDRNGCQNAVTERGLTVLPTIKEVLVRSRTQGAVVGHHRNLLYLSWSTGCEWSSQFGRRGSLRLEFKSL